MRGFSVAFSFFAALLTGGFAIYFATQGKMGAAAFQSFLCLINVACIAGNLSIRE